MTMSGERFELKNELNLFLKDREKVCLGYNSSLGGGSLYKETNL